MIIIVMNTDKKKFLFKIYKKSKNWRILSLPLIWIYSASE